MRNRKGSLAFIFITILVDVIGLGIIIPVIPDLIKELGGEGVSASNTYGEAGGIGTLLMISFAGMQFIFAPVLGELSDRFGRRPILLISLLGLGIDYIFHAFAPTLMWLFVGRFIAGICGASFSVASAYIADISTPENKAKNFGMIGVAFGVGFIIGPVLGGVFGEHLGLRAPFYVAAALSLLNFLYGLFILPESLSQENRRPIELRKMIPGSSLKNLTKFKPLGGLVLAFFLAQIAGQALPSTWNFFTLESYGWEKDMVGYSLGAVGILVAIVQGGLIGPSVKRFGQKKVIIVGFILWTAGMALFSVAFYGWMLFVFLIPYALGGVASPTIQGLISNKIPANEQGNLQGTLTSLVGLSSIIGPSIAGGLFYLFTVHQDSLFYFPGAPYAMSAMLLLFGTLLARSSLQKMEE